MDVIGLEHARDDDVRSPRRWSAIRPGARTAGLVLAVVALAAFLLGRSAGGGGLLGDEAGGELTGRMVLELQPGAYVTDSRVSDQAEYRGMDWTGTIDVAGSSEHTGTARLQASASFVSTDSGPVIGHTWGTAEAVLDGQPCTGTFAYSFYRSSGEGGGSLHLRCEGGAVLGASITAGSTEPPADDGSRSWVITIPLTDGYLVEG